MGRGLEQGPPDIAALVARARRWRVAGRSQEAALLETIASGGVWHGQRRYDCGMAELGDSFCILCSRAEPDSARHRYWECAANRESACEAAIASQHLRHEAIEGVEAGCECF